MKSVMIVDDSLELGRLLQASLMVLDPTLKVVVVPSAEEAILESSRNPLDLLVTDIRLPGISGIELVRKIRARRPVVKIMLITGLSDAHLNQQVKELAVDAFFRKPLEIPVFLETARQCLGLSSETPQPVAGAGAEVRAAPEPKEEKKNKRDARVEEEAQMAEKLLESMPEAIPAKTLSDILTNLRQSLGALAALVLDERGRIIAQAGDPPDSGLLERIASPWMAVQTSSMTLGALLKPGLPKSVQVFRGEQVDFLFAPLGAYSLGIILPLGKSALRLALAFETALLSLDELAEVMGVNSITSGASLQSQVLQQDSGAAIPGFVDEEAPAPAEPPMGEFLSALENRPAAVKDADSFWDDSGAPPVVVATPDMLTYDQALQLGLAPDDKKE